MASPFRVFRKYQKTLLVVAGVILMFVFVIGDSLVAYLGASRGGGDVQRDAAAVAVRWNDGSLTNQELGNLVMRRRMVNSFLQSVEYAGLQSSVEAGVDPRELRVQSLLAQPTEQSVITTKLYADAAREAGMRVSDDAIVRYLDDLGRQRVSRDDMRAMLNHAGGDRVPIQYVMDALREEMLAHNYLASHQFALLTVTPQQGYRDWLRVNDRVAVEAAAIPVESFLVDVPEPTDAELTVFFDEHKQYEPQPDPIVLRQYNVEMPMPVTGFRIPRKINVQYLQANYDQFLANVENQITEEEIAKYYDENKDPHFIKADTGLFDLPGDNPADNASDEANTSATVPGTEAESTDAPGPATEPGNSTNRVETSSPAADGTQPPANSSQEQAVPGEGDQSFHQKATHESVFRFTALQEEQDTENSAAPAETSEPAANGSQPAAAGDSANTATSTADSASASAALPGDTAVAGEPPASEKPVEYQPLDEVRDEIRTRLARDRVNEQLTTLMGELQSQVNAEFTTYYGARLSAESEQRTAPAPPAALSDLSPLAAQHGLNHGNTGPLSWLELRKTPVGASGDMETGNELYRILFATQDLELHQPISTVDVDGNRFLAMKTDDTPGRIPTLTEIRDDVVRAWKLQKAAERAQKHAEEQAKEAQAANKPLTDFFADNQNVKVVRTDPFSRYTGGEVALLGNRRQQQPFRLSEPDGIVAAGPEFMEKVFSLKQGDVGAILNHDHSIAYVVRVADHLQSTDELRAAYLMEAGNWPGMGLMIGDHARIVSGLLTADLHTSRDLKWERLPDQPEEAEPADDE